MEAEVRPLPRFEYFSPSSLGEALKLLKDHQERGRLLAGGTDLVVKMKKRATIPDAVIDLNKIAALSFIKFDDGNLRIGGLTRLAQIKDSPLVKQKAPALAEAASVMASTQIRNRATLAGNLCNASPAADTAPALLVLDASVKLQSAAGERVVPLAQFFLGPEQTVRKPNEIMTEIIIPDPKGESTFIKLGRRKAFTLSVVAVAAYARVSKGKFSEVRVALGAVAPTPIRADKLEKALKGKEVTEENIDKAAELVKIDCCPITDIRASADYRTAVSAVLAKRALKKVSMGEK